MARVSATATAAGKGGMGTAKRVSAVGIAAPAHSVKAHLTDQTGIMGAMHSALRAAQAKGVKDPLDLRRIILDARDAHLRAQ